MSNESNVTVKGEVDAGFSSYYDPSKHGTMSNGTTVAASDDGETGSIEFDNWPSEAPDPESLTDKQRKTIEVAVSNPTLTTTKIDERVGSTGYANKVLMQKVPEWYNNVFKEHGGSGRNSETKNKTSTEEDTTAGVDEYTDTDVERVIERCKAFEDVLDGEAERVAAHIRGLLE